MIFLSLFTTKTHVTSYGFSEEKPTYSVWANFVTKSVYSSLQMVQHVFHAFNAYVDHVHHLLWHMHHLVTHRQVTMMPCCCCSVWLWLMWLMFHVIPINSWSLIDWPSSAEVVSYRPEIAGSCAVYTFTWSPAWTVTRRKTASSPSAAFGKQKRFFQQPQDYSMALRWLPRPMCYSVPAAKKLLARPVQTSFWDILCKSLHSLTSTFKLIHKTEIKDLVYM